MQCYGCLPNTGENLQLKEKQKLQPFFFFLKSLTTCYENKSLIVLNYLYFFY